MLSFARSGLLFVALGLALFALLGRVAEGVAPVYPVLRERWTKLEARAGEVEVLVVGASHGQGVHLGSLGANGFHLWSHGQDLFESEALLAAWLPRLPEVHTVLMPLGFTCFVTDNALDVPTDRSELRRQIYRLLPATHVLAGDWRNALTARAGSVVRDDHWRGVFAELTGRVGARSAELLFVADDGFLHRRGVGGLRTETIGALVERQVERHRRLFGEMLEADPDVSVRSYASLARIVELARAHDVRLILFAAPLLGEYRASFDEEMRLFAEQRFAALEREYGVRVHDFSAEPSIVGDPALFEDPNHLNREGALRFSTGPLLEVYASD